MRILRFFFLALLWITLSSALLFFVGREVLLVFGAGAIKNAHKTLATKNYAKLCAEKFAYNQDYYTQIRFTSSREYNLEVVCLDFTATPILLEQKKLPPLLFKKSFGTGFVIDERELPAFLELAVLGRSIYVYAEENVALVNYGTPPDLDYDQGPSSTCQAHNYQCCNSDLESGLGAQVTTVNDCPKSCYESCLLRPSFLSFNSQPAYDSTEQLVELSSGETLTLSYVLGNGKGDVFSGQIDKNSSISLIDKLQVFFSDTTIKKDENMIGLPVTVLISFGDGQTWNSNNFQDSVDHIYYCANQSCYFQVQILASDANEITSVNNELTKMIVKVNGR